MPDKTNENDYMDEQQQLHFDDLRQIDEYARAAEGKIDGLYAETEMTMDADEARMLDVDRMALKEEEDFIEENLKDGHYIDGYEVSTIHQKYEKHIDQLKKELEKAEEEDPAKVPEINKDIEKLKASRNKELQKLCDEAPKYNRSAIRAMMTQQLRNNDAGRVGNEIKIYRKEEGHDGLLATTYGKNRVGEINKMIRRHDEKAAELAGRKAVEQKRNLGHSTKEFLQGDAEHMFKGSISMGLHAALFLLNKLSQAGNKSAQWALYLYARNKLTMGDLEALQKAVNDTSQKSILRTDENKAKTWNGTIEPMDFNNQELPPFDDMEKCETYDQEHNVLNVVASYIDDNGTMRQGSVYLGSEANIRQFLEDSGVENEGVEAEIAENAAKVETLGIENLMVENVQEAYEEAAKKAEEDVEEAWEEECEEELEEAEEAYGEEASEVVLEPGNEDIFSDILGESPEDEVEEEAEEAEEETEGKAKEKTEENVDQDDVLAVLNSDNGKGIVDDAHNDQNTNNPTNPTKNLGDDGRDDR